MLKNTFYKDKSNEEAFVMIGLIAETDVKSLPNPVIIYGDSNNGKSHLIGILKERLVERKKSLRIINSEEFVSEIVYKMMNSESVSDFYEEFTKFDLVVVEDLQYLQGKASSQQCLIDISERLIRQEKQIVFTMNCHPEQLRDDFDLRLKAKFENSVQIPILSPTKKLKKKLIMEWCRDNGQVISKKMIKKISRNSNSVGELLGFLKQLYLYIDYYGLTLSKKLINRTLKVRGMEKKFDSTKKY